MLYGESLLVGLTAPSGAGKSYMTDAVLRQWPEFQRPVVATTRDQRPGEVEVHRSFMTNEEFAKAVLRGEVVLPHRPFREESTPEYGFVRETLDCDKSLITEVHSSIIQPFRVMTAYRKVVMVGMLASEDTLAENIHGRHDGVADGLAYRMRSSEVESKQIAEALSQGLLDIVVGYESEQREESERLVIDFISSHLNGLGL